MNIAAAQNNTLSNTSKTPDNDQQVKLLKLQKACRDFESIFIYYMLKTMRSASSKSNLFGEGLGSEVFQQMFDQGLAEKMSETGQFGISDKMYNKYAEMIGAPKATQKLTPTDFRPVTHKIIPAQNSQPSIPIKKTDATIQNGQSQPIQSIDPQPEVTSNDKSAENLALDNKDGFLIDDKLFIPEGSFPSIEKMPVAETPKNISKKEFQQPNHYDSIIHEAAAAHKVDPQLVKAVILQESGGNPKAVSSKGAKGLMQLMDGTARMLGINDPFDIKENIFGGVKYLASLLQRFEGDIKKALAAYNAGPAAVEKYNGVPPYEETTKFVESVISKFGGLFNSDKSR